MGDVLMDFKYMHLLSLIKRYVDHSEIFIIVLTRVENYSGAFDLKF